MSNAKGKQPCALRRRAAGIAWAIQTAAKRLKQLVEDSDETSFLGEAECHQALMIRDELLNSALALSHWTERTMDGGK